MIIKISIAKKSVTKQLSRAKALNEKSTTSSKKIVLPKKTLKITLSSPSRIKSKKSINQVPDTNKKILPITLKSTIAKPRLLPIKATKELPKMKPKKTINQVSKITPKTIKKVVEPVTISASTLETDDNNTTPATITQIFADYYTFVINETPNKIPEPLELHTVKEILLKLITKKDNKYTSISEYLIAKGKQQHSIEIKDINLVDDFRKFILKLSTMAATEWINVMPENNIEKLLIKLLKIKR